MLRTRVTARNLTVLDQVDSTNQYLKDRAFDLPHGATVVAASQTSGRGSKGRVWSSPMGEGVFFSVLYRPQVPFDFGVMTPGVGLAVCRGLRRLTNLPVMIKWPNDPVVDGKKIGGILCESVWQGSQAALILGIGINLSASREQFLQRDLPHAASLAMLGWEKLTGEQVASAILDELEPIYDSVCQRGELGSLAEQLSQWCVTLGRRVRISTRDEEFEAMAESIDPQGRLVVSREGQKQVLTVSEVSVRGLYGYAE